MKLFFVDSDLLVIFAQPLFYFRRLLLKSFNLFLTANRHLLLYRMLLFVYLNMIFNQRLELAFNFLLPFLQITYFATPFFGSKKYEGEKVFQLLYEAFSKSEPIEPKVILETPIEASNAKVTPQEIPTSREAPQEIPTREAPQEIPKREAPQENVPTKSKNQELTSLDDLGGEELFEVDETTKETSSTGDPKNTNKNLPVKPPSKLAAQAAAIAAAREAHDSSQPRPNGNIIPR